MLKFRETLILGYKIKIASKLLEAAFIQKKQLVPDISQDNQLIAGFRMRKCDFACNILKRFNCHHNVRGRKNTKSIFFGNLLSTSITKVIFTQKPVT